MRVYYDILRSQASFLVVSNLYVMLQLCGFKVNHRNQMLYSGS